MVLDSTADNRRTDSYTVGTTNVLSLITAQRTYAQARQSYANAQVQQFEDTAGLLVALGGAWWNAPGATPAADGPSTSPQ